MTVVDVNTGKFIGSGGNLEETVTKNNLEAAEEIVRQLRLRDIGGIIVIDFIDMVLESNRDLVLRRLLECLGRDRTKHQVAEVTSLGLVQMTRKRVGQGLLEVFSEPCEPCNGRGVIVHPDPVDDRKAQPPRARRPSRASRRRRRGRGRECRGARGTTSDAPAETPRSRSRSRASCPRGRQGRRRARRGGHGRRGPRLTVAAQGELAGYGGLRGWPPPPTLEPDLGNASGGNHGSVPFSSCLCSRTSACAARGLRRLPAGSRSCGLPVGCLGAGRSRVARADDGHAAHARLVRPDQEACSATSRPAPASRSRSSPAGDAGEVVNKAVLTAGNPEGDVLFGVDNTLLTRASRRTCSTPTSRPSDARAPPRAQATRPATGRDAVDYGDVCVEHRRRLVRRPPPGASRRRWPT